MSPEDAYPSLIQNKLDHLEWPVEVIGAGLSGETSAGGLRRLSWLLKKHFDVMILELGANDGLRGLKPEETYRNLAQIVTNTRAAIPDCIILLAGMQVPPNMGATYASEFAGVFPRLAKDLDLVLIPFLLEGVAGDQGLNLADGIHPNVAGHRIVAETVWHYLEPVIDEQLQRDNHLSGSR